VIVFNNRMRYHGGFVICQIVAAPAGQELDGS